jgi:hypothetical protein
VVTAAVASAFPVVTYFGVRHQRRSGRVRSSKAVELSEELKAIHAELDSIRTDVAELKIQNQVTS